VCRTWYKVSVFWKANQADCCLQFPETDSVDLQTESYVSIADRTGSKHRPIKLRKTGFLMGRIQFFKSTFGWGIGRLLEEDKFFTPRFFSLLSKTKFREKITRQLLEML
jgi:hypothetical protein